MSAYTVTTSVAQDAALTYLVGVENTRRAAQTPPLGTITNQQYLDAVSDSFLNDYVRQFRRASAITKLTATPAVLPTALEIAALGLA